MSSQPHVWHYLRETLVGTTEQIGPISQAELLELARSGKLKRDAHVSSPTQTQGKWHAVQQIPGLLKAVEAGEQQRQESKAATEAQRAAEKQAAEQARQSQRDQQSRARADEQRAVARISDCTNVEQVQTIQERVRGILTSNETIELITVQWKPLVNLAPDAVIATSRRLIFYRPKLLGRFEFEDYAWLDLSDAHLKQNMLASVFTARHVSGRVLTMDSLTKEGAQRLYRLAQEREEQARLARQELQLNVARASASQITIGAMPAAPAVSPGSGNGTGDPMARLQKLKALADGGLITAADFAERKRQILAEV